MTDIYINNILTRVIDTETLYSDDGSTYTTLYIKPINTLILNDPLNIKIRVFDALVHEENYEVMNVSGVHQDIMSIKLRHLRMRV